jgi:hypothetical protein
MNSRSVEELRRYHDASMRVFAELLSLKEGSEKAEVRARLRIRLATLEQDLTAVESNILNQVPKWAGFFVALFAKTPADADALIGCMNERFVRDCARYGVQRATILYWKEALRSLWPLIRRALGRAMKWAAIISAVKRYFTG